MIVIMPTTIGGAMVRMWLTMEPRVRSFMSFHFRRRGLRTSVRQPRAISSPHCCTRSELDHLTFEQAAIEAACPRRQRLVGALLDDLAAVENQDAIEAAHRRQAVRDHDRGSALHQ